MHHLLKIFYVGCTESNTKVGMTFLLTDIGLQIAHVGRVTLPLPIVIFLFIAGK
jgi:hypothetical protein